MARGTAPRTGSDQFPMSGQSLASPAFAVRPEPDVQGIRQVSATPVALGAVDVQDVDLADQVAGSH